MTTAVKEDAAALWRKLVELHEGGAHEVLGYASWGDYVTVEFGFTRVHAYRLLRAADVLKALGSNPGVTGLRERHLRELVPLLDRPGELQQVVQIVAESGKVTVARLREAVEGRLRDATSLKTGADGNGDIGVEPFAKDINDDLAPGRRARKSKAEASAESEWQDQRKQFHALGKLVRATSSDDVAVDLLDGVTQLVRSVGEQTALERIQALLAAG
jgi:hypothetical protein